MKLSSYSRQAVCWTTVLLFWSSVVLAQGTSPWLNTVSALEDALTNFAARGLFIIAMVIGMLMFVFGEGGFNRALAKIIIGLGMAILAGNLIIWLF